MNKKEYYIRKLHKITDWEPYLLKESGLPGKFLAMLDAITESIYSMEDRRSDEFKALRKGMGYCWSVAVAAYPEQGKKLMERWLQVKIRIYCGS